MGLVAKVLDFIRTERHSAKVSDTKADSGGGAIFQADHFSAPGDDSHPLPDDYVLFVSVRATGRQAAAGYIDPKNTQAAQPGERRTYSRDEAGEQVAQVWCKNDGTILIENDAVSFTLSPDGTARADNGSGYYELQSGGTVEANGATIPTNGDVITASGTSLDNHTHAQGNDSAGNSQAETEKPS